jgi:hypothetical protein
MSRSRIHKTERIVLISFVLVCVVFCGLNLAVLAFFEIAALQNLPKIQAALDKTCGTGAIVAELQYYGHEFSDYSSPQASCFVGSGEYSCECRLTPTPLSAPTLSS